MNKASTDIIKENVRHAPSITKRRIMVAGIGNTFLQDDGFGTAVISKIKEKGGATFKNVEINDAGIGGLKLAYDLMKGYDGLILVDATSRGEEPGTIYVIEPDEKEIDANLGEGSFIDPHGADPATVLKFVKALGAWPGKVIIVGCEPFNIDDFEMGLSGPVKAAVDRAVEIVEEIIETMSK